MSDTVTFLLTKEQFDALVERAPALKARVKATCARCGGAFEYPFRRGRPRKYCGATCADAAKAAKDRGRKRSDRPGLYTAEEWQAHQRTPERRAELSRATKALVEQCRKLGKVWGRGQE